MKYSLPRNALLGVLGATTALAAVTLARAEDCCATKSNPATTDCCATTSTTVATTTGSDAAPSAGLVAAKDPVTGQLRAPTPEEIAALQPAKPETKGKAEAAPLRSQLLPNGAVVTTLDSSYDLYSVATKDADGKIQRACVPAAQLDAVMKAAQNGELTKKEVLDEK